MIPEDGEVAPAPSLLVAAADQGLVFRFAGRGAGRRRRGRACLLGGAQAETAGTGQAAGSEGGKQDGDDLSRDGGSNPGSRVGRRRHVRLCLVVGERRALILENRLQNEWANVRVVTFPTGTDHLARVVDVVGGAATPLRFRQQQGLQRYRLQCVRWPDTGDHRR
jgi:hypothetical protein